MAEKLEDRLLLTVDSVIPLPTLSSSGATGEKPQSKVWEEQGHFWAVLKHNGNMDVMRLDADQWTSVLTITSGTYAADVKVVGDVVHVLLEKNSKSLLASLQFVDVGAGSYEFWDQRPGLVSVPMPKSAETATIDIDSTGRMWTAYDNSGNVEVRYSDGNYETWSDAIVLETGIASDDIAALTALPNGTIGVMWSNQKTERFGFRVHVDGAAPDDWSADEIPGSQSALNAGNGMADDHINLAVGSDGTLYAAVKTGYDSSSTTTIGLLMRSPDGVWSDLYDIDHSGTRPVVQISEVTDTIVIAYRKSDNSGPIEYREARLSTMDFGPVQMAMDSSSPNNVSGMKANFTNNFVLAAGSSSSVYGAEFTTSLQNGEPPINMAPSVSAGSDQLIVLSQQALLDGTVSDDGLPTSPGLLATTWSKVSGPGTVSFGNAADVDTTAGFSTVGTYVLRLTANDGALITTDDVTITVSNVTPVNQSPSVAAGADQTIFVTGTAALDGTVSDDGLPTIPGFLTTYWTKASGPGTVTFANASAVDTTASFSAVGTYVLRLTADDGQATASDVVTIVVNQASGHGDPTTVEASFQDGVSDDGTYNGTRDTYIRASSSANKNYGSKSSLHADGSPDSAALIQWDVSGLAPGGTVTAASITLNVTNASSVEYEVYQMLRSWSEGEATWNQAAGGADWGTAGAQSTSDHASTPLTIVTSNSKGLVTFELNAAGLAMVQSWIDNPSSNHGIIIQDYVEGSNGLDVSSRETGNADDRPRLDVTYETNGGTQSLLAANDAYTVGSGQTLTTTDANGTVGGTANDGVLVNDPITGGGSAQLVSGPTHGTLTLNPNGTFTYSHDGSSAGSDSFQYRIVSGSNQSSPATVTIAISAANEPPSVFAGADQAIVVTGTAALNGTVTDDGLPTSPGSVTTQWSKVSGPGTVSFGNTAAVDTTAGFSTAGTYVLRLTANDGALVATDDVTITVSNVPPVNQPPSVAAGADQTILVTGTAALDGTVSDDGLPTTPGYLTTSWTKVSGPGTVSFGNASAVDTTASFGTAGTYVLRLTADDGQLTASDTVTVVVNPNSGGGDPVIVTATFQDGVSQNGTYSGTRDTTLDSATAQTNLGSRSGLEVDGSPDAAALIQWDISNLTPGGTVTAASITLNVTNTSSIGYEIYGMLRAWSESEATWNQAANGSDWNVAGAQSAGVHSDAPLGTVTATNKGLMTFELNAAGLAMVQSWIDNPSSNHGIIIQDYDEGSNGIDVSSREAGTASHHPLLSITYELPAGSQV